MDKADKFKSLNVDQETYDTIIELAKANGRTIYGQVAFMTRLFRLPHLPHNELPKPNTEPMPPELAAPMVAPTEGN
jgi:hypothetical protein